GQDQSEDELDGRARARLLFILFLPLARAVRRFAFVLVADPLLGRLRLGRFLVLRLEVVIAEALLGWALGRDAAGAIAVFAALGAIAVLAVVFLVTAGLHRGLVEVDGVLDHEAVLALGAFDLLADEAGVLDGDHCLA